jgi:uncharacterized protein (TIGR00299 family) protein
MFHPMKILFFDLSTGVSGDKINAALYHLHGDKPWLENAVKALKLDGVSLALSESSENGIRSVKFEVKQDHPEHHHHRGLSAVKDVINKADLAPGIKEFSVKIFTLLAEAEAKVHGSTVDQVHFHEVGAVDAIVDIVCAAASVVLLAPDRIYSTPFTLEAGGTAKSSHGVIPVPVPAVMEIVRGKPVRTRNVFEEMVTPTGAAIVAGITDVFDPPPAYTPLRSGYGAGTKKFDFPNLLRVVEGVAGQTDGHPLFVVETNIDDMNPQIIPDVIASLLSAGAVDAFVANVLMKKSRPGWLVTAIVPEDLLDRALGVFFSSTSTIGCRYYPVQRACLEREIVAKKTPVGEVRFKRVVLPDGTSKEFPEYEDVKKLAGDLGIPVYQVYQRIR